MLIADKVMEAFSGSPDRPLTIPDLARMLGASAQHVRTGVMVLVTSGEVAASGTRMGHGRSAVIGCGCVSSFGGTERTWGGGSATLG
jgi:hypothetical protein